jgi:hypothetical protein
MDIRGDLAEWLEEQSAWRAERAATHPDDRRNQRAADGLMELARQARSLPEADPTLAKLTNLCEGTGLTVRDLMPTDPATGVNASQFRFHDPQEDSSEFLQRLADGAVSEYHEAHVAEFEKEFDIPAGDELA